ncbi:uncharacterized protein B0H18DRAFT_64372 [Fomitopsis serialis]|uniref:uncharacterized protein n=1 Tax=Fomitopsis serialis TaxID=139415 RepID=UPI0020076CC1|nr:uncharacterized protein B0H18DRAFT_64372 [Neoantrodia serialis]KAH9916520.1 hypothetical protein B0H18DRAFT_64372 [Neoantrodia serialis]
MVQSKPWSESLLSCLFGQLADCLVPTERHYNLSHHDHLWRLEIWLYHPFAVWPWIPHILSRVTSKHFQAMCVMLLLRDDHMVDDLDGMLTRMEQDDVLERLDSILQEKRFSSTAVSRGICLGIDHDNNSWKSGDELFGIGSGLRERFYRWDEVVRRRMPHSHGRGILSTVHDTQERDIWMQDMDRSMQAKQKNAAEQDVHPRAEAQDEDPRDGAD